MLTIPSKREHEEALILNYTIHAYGEVVKAIEQNNTLESEYNEVLAQAVSQIKDVSNPSLVDAVVNPLPLFSLGSLEQRDREIYPLVKWERLRRKYQNAIVRLMDLIDTSQS